jgi:hypothetical protein
MQNACGQVKQPAEAALRPRLKAGRAGPAAALGIGTGIRRSCFPQHRQPIQTEPITSRWKIPRRGPLKLRLWFQRVFDKIKTGCTEKS